MKGKGEIKKRLERFELSNKPKVIITENLKRQIDFLHAKVGNNEWSGELITREEASISDLDNWKIICEEIFLADIGTSGGTEYKVDEGGFKAVDIVEMFDKYPGLLEGTKKNQHIHTHHNMGAFFSGPDWENLEDRAESSNYLMMLVVNFSGKYCAKVAFKGKIKEGGKSSIEFANNTDEFPNLELIEEKERDVLVVMDCEIIHESPVITVSNEFEERYNKVKFQIEEDKKPKTTYYPAISRHFPPFSGKKDHQKDLWGDYDNWGYDKKNKRKNKKISEMSDKEWKEYQKVTGAKVDTKDVFTFLNANLLNTHDLVFTSPVPNITDVNNKFRDSTDRKEWLLQFQFTMRDKFDAIFYPRNSDIEFSDLVLACINFLNPYCYNQLAKEMVEILIEESQKATYADDWKHWTEY